MSDPQLILREEDHTYWLGKRRIPSVSEVIQPVCNFDGVHVDILERKQEIGKNVHLLCEWFDLKKKIDARSIDPALKPYFEAYKDFVKKMKPKWTIVEKRDWHRTLGYAGTPDRYGHLQAMGMDRWMIDLKCVAKVSPATGLQTAAYCELVHQAEPTTHARRAAVQLKPDGTWRFEEFTNTDDRRVFLSLLSLWNWRTKHGI